MLYLYSSLLSKGLTVLIDTYFWKTKYPLWPELFGVYFNVFQGKSADWGVHPSSFSLPFPFSLHLLPFPTPGLPPPHRPPHPTHTSPHTSQNSFSHPSLALLTLLIDAHIRSLLWPTMVFIGTMSMLGHKEWWFIVYVVPLWNVAGARGCVWT